MMYQDLDDSIKKSGVRIAYTKFQVSEIIKCSTDVFYFIENYVKIVDPVKGVVPFVLFDYQREMILSFHENRNTVVMAARQLGKTTCAVAYMLWLSVFHTDQIILIVSNIFSSASEIMERFRFSYEQLPIWIKPGVKVYNKNSISFENNSRVVARATTKNSGRGLSISLLYSDELSAVDMNKQKEFWSAIRPTLSTGGKCIITSTPNNDQDVFAKIWNQACDCFDDHGNPQSLGKNMFKALKFTWQSHPHRDEAWAREELTAMGGDVELFEREHNCNFVGFDETLVSQMVLSKLTATPVLYKTGSVRWYQRPNPQGKYLIALDPAMGTGGDYAAIQVFEALSMVQVAEWQHNKTGIPDQIKILKQISEHLSESNCSEIFWSIENNSIGEAANIVIKEIGEYQIAGSFISEPLRTRSNRTMRKGFNTTQKSKLRACSRLKSLVEKQKILLCSEALITQLKNYVHSAGSYAAKTGTHDDLVSATLLAMRILEQVMTYDDEIHDKFREKLGDSDESSDSGMRMPLSFV